MVTSRVANVHVITLVLDYATISRPPHPQHLN